MKKLSYENITSDNKKVSTYCIISCILANKKENSEPMAIKIETAKEVALAIATISNRLRNIQRVRNRNRERMNIVYG